jgi:predicted RNase H-like HicB family nuclease
MDENLRSPPRGESAAVLEFHPPRRIFVLRPRLHRQSCIDESPSMKIKVVVHEAEEGGFWAEVPAIPGCATQGETMDELVRNLHEAIEGCLAVERTCRNP